MKKIILLFIGILLVTGCSNKEKELCNKIDSIEVNSFTSEERYEDLALILDDYFQKYCENSNSNVCKALNEYIQSTRNEIEKEDCSKLEGGYKEICNSNNKLAIIDKKIDVNYRHEELRAICNE